jgi:hypothetical protein
VAPRTHHRSESITIVNPLPLALRHYQETLVRGMETAGLRVSVSDFPSAEARGRWWLRAISLVTQFSRSLTLTKRGSRSDVILVLWPSLGLLDVLLWAPASLRRRIRIIVHDPVPLRFSIGMDAWSGYIARVLLARFSNIELITHTRVAQDALLERFSIGSSLVLHPIDAPASSSTIGSPQIRDARVLVLGQYKPARDLGALVDLAADLRKASLNFEIVGSDWPAVAGWSVTDDFVTEDVFDRLIRESLLVVIPYRNFFQSGVATRALELGTPVVSPRHEFIEGLFGIDWPGLVEPDEPYSAGVRRVTDADSGSLFPLRARAFDKFMTSLGSLF